MLIAESRTFYLCRDSGYFSPMNEEPRGNANRGIKWIPTLPPEISTRREKQPRPNGEGVWNAVVESGKHNKVFKEFRGGPLKNKNRFSASGTKRIAPRISYRRCRIITRD